jgi:pimeloyl-[acyl-carrier protein] methyl ester esterase
VRAALAGMASCLEDAEKTRAMLRTFLLKIASPQSVELLRAGPADGPLDENNRMRLREDLALLERCNGLPEGFPPDAKVLIVEAGQDQIVEPEARAMLRAALPGADVINLPDAGHALLAGNVIERVVDWVETWRR